jgi:hypothetical protein
MTCTAVILLALLVCGLGDFKGGASIAGPPFFLRDMFDNSSALSELNTRMEMARSFLMGIGTGILYDNNLYLNFTDFRVQRVEKNHLHGTFRKITWEDFGDPLISSPKRDEICPPGYVPYEPLCLSMILWDMPWFVWVVMIVFVIGLIRETCARIQADIMDLDGEEWWKGFVSGESKQRRQPSTEIETLKLPENAKQMQMRLECPICLENVKNAALECGHCYCPKCLEDMRIEKGKSECPQCFVPYAKPIKLYL